MSTDLRVTTAGEALATLVARIPESDLAKLQGDRAAINVAVTSINDKLKGFTARIDELDTQIARRSKLALILKGITIFGGVVVVSDYFPWAVRLSGLLIMLAGALDYLLANHGRLMNNVTERDSLTELIESVSEADTVAVTVLRLASREAVRAIMSYADFMQLLQSSLTKGHREVRSAARSWERDVLGTLSVPTYMAVSEGTKANPSASTAAAPADERSL